MRILRKLPYVLAATLTVAVGLPAPFAYAAGGLTVTPLTWNVIGLDSNKVTVGPELFPVGARVCNTTSATASAAAASIVFDSSSTFINLFGPSSLALGDLAPGACSDAYFNVQVTRSVSAYNTSRAFHIAATSGALSGQTPANRELYVEKLVSQNRNSVDSVTSTAIDTAPSSTGAGHATVYLGRTYVFHVNSHTATGGYEQLESEVTFPTPIFRVLNVSATYAVPTGATNDRMYADACGWDNVTTSTTYRSCVGPANYTGGKAGGNPIGTDYTVQVVGTGAGSVSTLIYDFSGSSYHYNSDYGLGTSSLAFDAVPTPTAVDDSATTTRGTAVTISSLANDTGGVAPLAITGHSTPANGTASCTASACTYTPTGAFTGTDSFTYTIADANGATSTATDTVTVHAVPIAVADSAVAGASSPVTVNVLANDTAGEGTTAVSSHSAAAHGTVTCTASTCTYTPDAGYAGNDAFTYVITDANGATATATVSIEVLPPPGRPGAFDDVAGTDENTPVTLDPSANDVLGTTPTSLAVTSAAAHGTAACASVSSCTYTPDAGFTGTDAFGYTLTDNNGATSSALVTVTVYPVPVAADDSAATNTGTAVAIDVLANDDPGVAPATVSGHTAASHGAVACTSSTCTYTPAPGFTGADSFGYTITDSRGLTSTAAVAVTVYPVPVAVDDTATTDAGVPVDVAVAANDLPGVAPTTVTAHTAAGNGAVSCGPSACTYTPDAGFSGVDSFGYTITDSRAQTSAATVTVTVNPAPPAPAALVPVVPVVPAGPVATADTASAAPGAPVTIDVTGNDSGGTAPLTVSGHSSPAHGSVACTTTACTYTPDAGYTGTDTFTYTITDARGQVSTAAVTVSITPLVVAPAVVAAPPATVPAEVPAVTDVPASPASPTVPGPSQPRPARHSVPSAVPPAPRAAVAPTQLAFTGAPLDALCLLAMALLGVGLPLALLRRTA